MFHPFVVDLETFEIPDGISTVDRDSNRGKHWQQSHAARVLMRKP